MCICVLAVLCYIPQIQDFLKNIYINFNSETAYIENYELNIHVLNVGTADCILIEGENFCYMIDGGTPDYSEYISTYVQSRGITELDAIFITHPDYDHYSGITEVITDIDVGMIYVTDAESDNSAYERFVETVNKENISFTIAEKGDIFVNGSFIMEVVAPVDYYDDTNNMSLVIRLDYNNFSMLLTGDAEEYELEDLMNSDADIDCDLLKVSHHGSYNGTSYELLEAVTPDFAVISTDPADYDFPDQVVIDLLEEFGVEYYRTDLDNTVIFSTDGNGELLISTKENIYERTYS